MMNLGFCRPKFRNFEVILQNNQLYIFYISNDKEFSHDNFDTKITMQVICVGEISLKLKLKQRNLPLSIPKLGLDLGLRLKVTRIVDFDH